MNDFFFNPIFRSEGDSKTKLSQGKDVTRICDYRGPIDMLLCLSMAYQLRSVSFYSLVAVELLKDATLNDTRNESTYFVLFLHDFFKKCVLFFFFLLDFFLHVLDVNFNHISSSSVNDVHVVLSFFVPSSKYLIRNCDHIRSSFNDTGLIPSSVSQNTKIKFEPMVARVYLKFGREFIGSLDPLRPCMRVKRTDMHVIFPTNNKQNNIMNR